MNELSTTGELFITYHTNPADGMTYIRVVPASLIDNIETDANDRERELRFHEASSNQVVDGITKVGETPASQGRWWTAEEMSHFTINRVTGAVRGQGDLVPTLPWLTRYKEWLDNRALVNKFKSAFVWDVKMEGANKEDDQGPQGRNHRRPKQCQRPIAQRTRGMERDHPEHCRRRRRARRPRNQNHDCNRRWAAPSLP